jgi:hypothetical protein
MDEDKNRSVDSGSVNPDRRDDSSNLDEEMERDTQIRRDTQVRGSLGIPPSGDRSGTREREEGMPEFDGESDDRSSERTSER